MHALGGPALQPFQHGQHSYYVARQMKWIFDREDNDLGQHFPRMIEALVPFAVRAVGVMGKGPLVHLPIPIQAPFLARQFVGQQRGIQCLAGDPPRFGLGVGPPAGARWSFCVATM